MSVFLTAIMIIIAQDALTLLVVAHAHFISREVTEKIIEASEL